MRGFMRQRGEAWELRVYIGRDAETGKRRYVNKTVRGGKREAEKALASMVAEVDRGGLRDAKANVAELLERWFEHAREDFSPSTARETRAILDRSILPALGAVPLNKLTVVEIDRFYRRLLKGGGQGGRPLAPGTVRRAHVVLRRALAQGVKWGWLVRNPAADASPPRVPKTEIHPPAPNQVARLFRLARESDPQLATFVLLAAATGARRSELVALRWSDFDLDQGTVVVSRGVVLGSQGLVEKDTKTHAARRIALSAGTVEALHLHHLRMAEIADQCGATLAPGAFVFTFEPDGSQPARPESMSRSFRRLCEQAGISGVRLHDLRHYVATRLLAAGVDVRTVAGRLGHRNASTTLNVYSHFLAESDREAANVLGRLFDEANGDEA